MSETPDRIPQFLITITINPAFTGEPDKMFAEPTTIKADKFLLFAEQQNSDTLCTRHDRYSGVSSEWIAARVLNLSEHHGEEVVEYARHLLAIRAIEHKAFLTSMGVSPGGNVFDAIAARAAARRQSAQGKNDKPDGISSHDSTASEPTCARGDDS